ncbi:MAG: hypothetical protein KC652_05985 [Cyanobacteria bacterium HKST-UBA01]|nr:hypothetical protein [Cyanobacteria bacterium HKST-UBA01]
MLPKFLLAAAILLLAVFFAYREALNAYFTCDDLWHMARLHQAFNGDFNKLFESFYGPWAGRKSAYLFYRPFTELTLALDYALFQGEARGYHLANLIYHWLNGLLVFSLSSIIFERLSKKKKQFLIPLLIALLFVLHPANAEPVIWILSRADLVSTFFYLSTIALALKAGKSGSLRWTYPLLLLGLLSKESCATLPLLIFLQQLTEGSSIRESFSRTKYHWLILAGYLFVRAWALESFTGGYVGSIGQMLNQSFFERLFIPLSLWKMFHPFNTEVFDATNFYSKLDEMTLRALYLVSGLLIVLNQIYSASASRRNNLFLLCLIAVTLLFSINIQVWSITDGMAGSRIAYLLFVPVAIGLVLLLVPFSGPDKKSAERFLYPVSIAVLVLFCLVYADIASINTKAWVRAGDETRAIQRAIVKSVQNSPPEKIICVNNLPAHIEGTIAFFSSDYLEGLLQPPLTKIDYSQKVFSLDGCPVQLPVLNSDLISLLKRKENASISYWDSQKKQLLSLPDVRPVESPILKVKELGFFKKIRGDEVKKLSNLYENASPGKDMRSYQITMPAPLTISDPWLLELVIETEAKADEVLPFFQEKSAVLSWPSNRKLLPVFLALGKNRGEKLLRVALGDYKSWIESGSDSVNLRLDLPYKGQVLKTARLTPVRSCRPSLLPVENPRFCCNGLIEVDGRTIDLSYDASLIEGATRTAIELSFPYCQFEVFKENLDKNLKKPGEHAMKVFNLPAGKSGNYRLDLGDTTAGAYHYLRLSALDKNGNILGTQSYPLGVLRGSCNNRSE